MWVGAGLRNTPTTQTAFLILLFKNYNYFSTCMSGQEISNEIQYKKKKRKKKRSCGYHFYSPICGLSGHWAIVMNVFMIASRLVALCEGLCLLILY